MKLYKFEESRRLFERAKKVIPAGAQPTRLPVYPEYPIFFIRAKGCRAWDVDGNEFIDLLCSIGPIVLGYAYDRVDEEVKKVMERSFQNPMNHPIQVELAEKLVEVIPSAEMVRFFKTGSEATHAAVRLARYFTGRDKVVRCGYHGWFDMWWEPDKPGVYRGSCEPILKFEGDAESLERVMKKEGEKVACVIMCPTELKPFSRKNLEEIKEITHRYGALLILDEIKTGFRVALGGVQEYLGVTPDLTTVSKAMANGYPVSALVGRKEIMEKIADTPTGGTFMIEALSLTASLATIRELEREKVIPHLWKMGERFIQGLNSLLEKYQIEGRAFGEPLPPMPRLKFHHPEEEINKKLTHVFFQGVVKRGLFFVEWHMGFVNFSHKDRDIDEALNICEDTFKEVKKKI